MEKSLIDPADLGRIGEEEACRFLRGKGCKILDRNYRCSRGEIDIVARDGKIVLFVEVKTRSSAQYAQPWEAVGHRKRQKIKLAAKHYVQEHSIRDCEFRFDVISIVISASRKAEIEWIQSAF